MSRILFAAALGAALLGFSQAQAADQIQVAVSTAGLDMGTAQGAATFNHRLHTAAVKVCMESAGIDNEMAAETRIEGCVRDKTAAALASAPAGLAAAAKSEKTASHGLFSWLGRTGAAG